MPPNWYHFVCYFTEQSLKGASSAVHFAPKGEEDKKKIKKKSGNFIKTKIITFVYLHHTASYFYHVQMFNAALYITTAVIVTDC